MATAGTGLTSRRGILGVLSSLALPGCAVTNVRTPSRAYQGAQPVRAAYIYSFMDLREGELGRRFLEQLRRQLGDALASHDVRNTQLSFNESPVRTEYAMASEPGGGRHSTTRVPVREVVTANLAAESSFGASHRLIVFPAMITRTGAGANFDVRWDLFDAASGRLEWFSLTSTRHLNWLYQDESAESRAKALVDNVIGEMLKAGVLRQRPVI